MAVIRVGAATETEMKEAKLRMEDALAATRAAVEEGIIAGGGSAYIHASKEVAKLADTLEGDEKTGANVVLKALEAPLFHIVANAGLEGAVIINKVRESEPGQGFDAYTEQYVDMVKDAYDYILIDCMPSLSTLTINVLSCADSVIIPVQAAYLPVKGLEQLIKTIGKVKRHLNTKIEIAGILLTMVDQRTNYAKDIIAMLKEAYGRKIRIFESMIPMSVRAQEASTRGVSIFCYDSKGKVAKAYQMLTKEVLEGEERLG